MDIAAELSIKGYGLGESVLIQELQCGAEDGSAGSVVLDLQGSPSILA